MKAFNAAKDKLAKKKERSAKKKETLARRKETLAKRKETVIINHFMTENGLKSEEQKAKFLEFYQREKESNGTTPLNAKLRNAFEEYRQKKEEMAMDNFMGRKGLESPEQIEKFL